MFSSLLVWLAVVTLLGWLHFPLCFRVGRLLRDRGVGLSKVAGVFLPTYVSWLLCHSPVPHTRATVAGVIAGLAMVYALIAWRDRRAYATFFRQHWRAVLTIEAVFWLGGLAAASVRSHCPAIIFDPNFWGAEKWSDFTLLSALTRQTGFPPVDPWLAGFPINYYYFGHLVWATLTKLTGIAPEITYNLSLATIVALALAVCVSLGYHLVRSLGLGILLAWLVVLGGNLKPAAQVHAHWPEAKAFAKWCYFNRPLETGSGGPAAAIPARDGREMPEIGALWGMFWASSREMYYGPEGLIYPPEPEINEFPSFSFILGDLHPHFSAHPLFLGCLLILAALWQANRRHTFSGREVLLDRMPLWLTLALGAGVLYMTNSWDCFVALFLAGVGLPFARGFRHWPASARVMSGLLILSLGYIVGTRLVALPYDLLFVPPKPIGVPVQSWWPPRVGLSPLGWVPPELRSATSQWLLYFGLFALPYFGWLLGETLARTPRVPIDRRTAWLSVALALGMIAFCQCQSRFVGLGFFALIVSAPVAFQPRRDERLEFIAVLCWTALLVSLLCEFFYYDDGFSGPNERINTVFKVYYCLWPVAALGAVGACAALWRRPSRMSKTGARKTEKAGAAPPRKRWFRSPASGLSPLLGRRVAAAILILLLVGVSSLYPLFAWAIRLAEYDRSILGIDAKPTLDGLEYLDSIPGLRDDYRAGLWLRENASPYAVVAEASEWGYSAAGRFAAVGGVTSMLGWSQHESLWREGFDWDPVAERQRTLDDLFSTNSLMGAVRILIENGVDYVAVGTLERRYGETALGKFEYLGRPVFQSGQTVLYHASRAISEALETAERDLKEWLGDQRRRTEDEKPGTGGPESIEESPGPNEQRTTDSGQGVIDGDPGRRPGGQGPDVKTDERGPATGGPAAKGEPRNPRNEEVGNRDE